MKRLRDRVARWLIGETVTPIVEPIQGIAPDAFTRHYETSHHELVKLVVVRNGDRVPASIFLENNIDAIFWLSEMNLRYLKKQRDNYRMNYFARTTAVGPTYRYQEPLSRTVLRR